MFWLPFIKGGDVILTALRLFVMTAAQGGVTQIQVTGDLVPGVAPDTCKVTLSASNRSPAAGHLAGRIVQAFVTLPKGRYGATSGCKAGFNHGAKHQTISRGNAEILARRIGFTALNSAISPQCLQNATNQRAVVAICNAKWDTPLGRVQADQNLCTAIQTGQH